MGTLHPNPPLFLKHKIEIKDLFLFNEFIEKVSVRHILERIRYTSSDQEEFKIN